MTGSNLSSCWSGRIETLVGAIFGFKHKYVLFSSLALKECSRMAVIILPNPNEGSITLGMNFYYPTFTTFNSNCKCFFSSLNYLSLILITIYPF